MEDKIYCGSGRIIKSKFGEIPKISMHKDDINKIVQYMKENGSDWINLEMKEKQNKQEGKPTHYLQIDTWKPNQNPDTSQATKFDPNPIPDTSQAPKYDPNPIPDDDDLPF